MMYIQYTCLQNKRYTAIAHCLLINDQPVSKQWHLPSANSTHPLFHCSTCCYMVQSTSLVSCPGSVSSLLLVHISPSPVTSKTTREAETALNLHSTAQQQHWCLITIVFLLKLICSIIAETMKKINFVPAETRRISASCTIPSVRELGLHENLGGDRTRIQNFWEQLYFKPMFQKFIYKWNWQSKRHLCTFLKDI